MVKHTTAEYLRDDCLVHAVILLWLCWIFWLKLDKFMNGAQTECIASNMLL